MSRRTRSALATAVSLLGAAGVAVGAWLPWLGVAPGHEAPVPAVHLPGMDAGLAGWDWLALAAAALALVCALPADRFRTVRTAAAAMAAGGLVAATTAAYLVSNANFLGAFALRVGFFLTALGGMHLAVGGALRLYALAD